MNVWKWNAANNAYTTLLPVNDEDLLMGLFSADGSVKTWPSRPRVKPALEKHAKRQLPLGDLSFIMGGSIVMNTRAHVALGGFLESFGQFLDMELVDPTGFAGGSQPLYFYNVTNLVNCIDVEHSHTEGSKILQPAFLPAAIPPNAQVFKDPLRRKADIYLNQAGHDRLTSLMESAQLRGSTLAMLAG